MQADKGVTNVVGFLHSAFMKAIAVAAGLAMLTTSTQAKEAPLTPDIVIDSLNSIGNAHVIWDDGFGRNRR